MSKFYIGQKIVAIKDHSQLIFKKGDEFTVLGISKCCEYGVNINVRIPGKVTFCNICGSNYNGIYFRESSFAPIELSITTFEDVIKQYETCLN